MSANREEGFVVGRFQPFHNEHLDYVLAAKKMCKFLWVGLAKFDPSMSESAFGETHRDDPKNNPLTYFERVRIISEVLTGCGVNRGEFGFLPFPIDEPKKMPWFVPQSIVCYTTMDEAWGEEKASVLELNGYTVEVLWEKPKKISASIIRNAIIHGDQRWKEMVPLACAKRLEEWDIRPRLVGEIIG